MPDLLVPCAGVVWLLAAVPDTMRAREASFASACDMALSVVLLPLAGWTRR